MPSKAYHIGRGVSTIRTRHSNDSDQKKSKATYPSIIGMDEARKKKMEHYQHALDAIQSFNGRADHLRNIALYIIERQQ